MDRKEPNFNESSFLFIFQSDKEFSLPYSTTISIKSIATIDFEWVRKLAEVGTCMGAAFVRRSSERYVLRTESLLTGAGFRMA